MKNHFDAVSLERINEKLFYAFSEKYNYQSIAWYNKEIQTSFLFVHPLEDATPEELVFYCNIAKVYVD